MAASAGASQDTSPDFVQDARAWRLGGAALLLGLVGFAGLTLLHPPLFDPQGSAQAMAEMRSHAFWELLHWGLAVAIGLFGFGLATLHALLADADKARYSSWAAGAVWTGMGLWLFILIVEAAAGRALAIAYFESMAGGGALATFGMAFADAVWRTLLALGYGAVALWGLAVVLWSCDLVHARKDGNEGSIGGVRMPGWIAPLGILAGSLAVVTQPFVWLLPAYAIAVLAIPLGLLSLWVAVVAVSLLRAGR